MLQSSKFKITLFVIGLLCFVVILVVSLKTQQMGPQSQLVVRQFPITSVELLEPDNASHQSSDELFTQQYQLVNVWASWCGICRQEHAYLNLLAEQQVTIIGLNYRDTRSAALNYIANLGSPYQHIVFDPKGKLALDLGVVGTPETYLVNQAGEIIYKHLGALDGRVWQQHFAAYFVKGANG
ncbi:DsbE family thiol:disulfide interchange protein [Vibrio pacinii]|uniref:DsbE family thiol:disulfide interchange protein n=1 Tax=Vibrio pacinii TaxID=170674 RepID=UPI000570CE6F|nr:DsbE family thiol:disulfide interchange protein [Vibrio pacinii]